MLKFRTGVEYFRAFLLNRLNYTVKYRKLLSIMIKTSLIDSDSRNYHFTQMPRINTSQLTQCYINDKRNGETLSEGLSKEKTLSEKAVDSQSVKMMLKKLFEFRSLHISSWLIEESLKKLCQSYTCLSVEMKNEFLEEISDCNIFQQIWLFSQIGKMDRGPGYLVKLREDLIDLITKKKGEQSYYPKLHELNIILLELLSMRFSPQFLELERITWKSSHELLHKISKYERVHPVRNWMDLRRRFGPYRRCFVFFHRSMPDEPIIILHVALVDKITSTLTDILPPLFESSESIEPCQVEETGSDPEEDVTKIKSAVFYSLSLSQKGLSGIGTSYYIIRRVSEKLQTVFPGIIEFSTLSPINTFKIWLLPKLRKMKSGYNDILFPDEVKKLQDHFNHCNYLDKLEKSLSSNSWIQQEDLCEILRKPLLRLCARYLYLEKTAGGYAIDGTANLHLKNGAVIWRINWKANPYETGLNSSFGLMVNYKYFLDDMQMHGKEYQEEKEITASEEIIELVNSAKKLVLNPTVRSKV